MIKYIFREDEPLRIKAANKADPQVIGDALSKISDKAGGKLTPSAVVDAARDKKSALHPFFEWDDVTAAEAYRLDQARSLIRVVRVEDETASEGSSRAYLSIGSDDGIAYRPLEVVKRSADLQLALMAQADKELAAFQRRYGSLKEVCSDVEAARAKLRRRLNKDETRAAA